MRFSAIAGISDQPRSRRIKRLRPYKMRLPLGERSTVFEWERRARDENAWYQILATLASGRVRITLPLLHL